MVDVFLISNFQLLRQGIANLLDSCAGRFRLLGSADRLDLQVLPWEEKPPDVVLLDLDTAPDQVLPWLQHWRTQGCPQVLLLSRHDNPQLQDQAVLAGARGVIDHNCPPEQMLTALEKVHEGQVWLDRQATARLLGGLSQPSPPSYADRTVALLTDREQQIVAMLLRHCGDSAKALAERLHISESTLRNHLTSIYEKCGVSNRSGLLAHALQSGLASRLAA